MAIFYRLAITRENYESFRRVLNDAPETFDEWEYKCREKAAHIESSGSRICFVNLDPNEFAADCRATGAPPNMHSLDNFAFKIGGAKKE
jgi:hypothetical protein